MTEAVDKFGGFTPVRLVTEEVKKICLEVGDFKSLVNVFVNTA